MLRNLLKAYLGFPTKHLRLDTLFPCTYSVSHFDLPGKAQKPLKEGISMFPYETPATP